MTLDAYVYVTSSFSLHPSSTSKEHVKNVHRRRTTTHTPFFYCLFASLVIQVSLLCVRQHLICLGDMLELREEKKY